ncbi:MAG TPA: peptidoglycan-binding protein LysM, partial [Pseudomonas sp.]|nr:peptidoglycan-binding protein LysM [Pseudomonas sp.]
MARIRNLFLILASTSTLYSGLVSALGLGDIDLHSALNQPLEARIELYQVGDMGSDDLKVRLASAEDFERAGVERLFFLSDLRFTPVLGGGRPHIRVTSAKPVREPYLNFIVELVRPGGSLLREYTVLIDPPGMAYAPVSEAEPAFEAAAPATRNQAPAAAQRPLPAASRGERYRVQRGDSLWTIAGRLQATGATTDRETLMADIHALNPAAFGGGDRNRLLAEVELLLPDSVAPTAEPVAAEVPTAPNVSADAAQVEAEQRQVDSELAQVTEQNQALQGSLLQLQSQLEQLQAQMAEKDRQLQQIQDELRQRQEAPPAPVAEPAAAAPAQQPAPVLEAEPTDRWYPWLFGALLVLLLLAALLLARRRRPARQAEPPTPAAEPEVRAAAPPARLPELVVEEPAMPAVAPGLAPPRLPGSSSDPLEGANIYIAYGRFAEAAKVLHRGIDQQPARLELRLRLLEVLGELGEGAAFAEQEHELRERGANPAQLEQIAARYAHLERPAEEAPLADAVLQLDETEPPMLAQDDFQLNLDDLSLDADWDLVTPFKPERAAKARPSPSDEVDPHFHSDLQRLPEVLEMDELPQEQALDDELSEAFLRETGGDLDELAGNREHLVKLNLALA